MLDMTKIAENVEMAEKLAGIKHTIELETRKAQLQREIETEDGLLLGQDRYLGEATCARCHTTEAQELVDDPHAHAFATLEKMGKAEDQACLPCHVTGFGAPGGFAGLGGTPEMKNVQCESCHGMGTHHDWTGTVAKTAAAEATCLQCHVAEWSPRWDYTAYLKRLAHGSPKS
jgi:nitrate/TMAO reductase-like tetraheme cytochrome c subunit